VDAGPKDVCEAAMRTSADVWDEMRASFIARVRDSVEWSAPRVCQALDEDARSGSVDA